ncbi:MAG TPA: hypothetical protein VN520_18440 [Streptomyces sp.]|nr:hypothetical protein [Streptomyces sp.]HWU08330.1 hypothetical protein [Streptomyces sp.]
MNAGPTGVEDLLRHHAPQDLGALVRRYGHFDTAEDAVQEALIAVSRQWPARGLPGHTTSSCAAHPMTRWRD